MGRLDGIQLTRATSAAQRDILTPQALAFLADLQRRFGARRNQLLRLRADVQRRIDAGWRPDFLPKTQALRAGDWRIGGIPAALHDRRVEITGPVDRKMIINALNSGANVFMADFEDSSSPTWENLLDGQVNLRDAVLGTIALDDAATGKHYALNAQIATLMVRPRGWHLPELHVRVDGEPMSGSLFDFGLFFFHNARRLAEQGRGPYFYLPKLENHLEARLWNDVLCHAQDALGMPRGTAKVTVLIETILAAFEMDEILYELRDHIVGLNCGRWDYIFSFIKKFRSDPAFVLPDRDQVGMTRHFLRSYSRLLVRTCHRRGAHAMGGMAAQIPIKNDPAASNAALDKVRADKLREVGDGHDGTWVAHPGLVELARQVFDAGMPAANQIDRPLEPVTITAADLLAVPEGTITEAGLRHNLDVGLLYVEAWLRGTGCVPLYNLMEDAATAEICRAQVWQWLRHGARLDDGRRIDADLVRGLLDHQVAAIRARIGTPNRLEDAVAVFATMILQPEFEEFLTLPALARLVSTEGAASH
jgi:malate synthase